MKKKSTTSNIEPSVGMGVTIQFWSDSYAGTIIQVLSNGKKLIIQEDNAIRTDSNGMSESQTYSYSPKPDGQIFHASKRKDGKYKLVTKENVVVLGVRKRYHDYSF